MSVDLSFFRSETSQRLRDEGLAKGRIEDILLILDTRGVEVTEGARERITSSTDLDELRGWLTRALTVRSADDLFTETDPETEAGPEA